jgi:2,3,4,5-tetrahydropyridine-2-carboxylate N-succinyltransferase
VLEPLQANPVVIEDNCFIGARSEVVEGVIVEEGAVLSMGVFISSTSKIIDRTTGEVFVGRVPAYSVVVPGSLPTKPLPDGNPGPRPVLRGDRQAGGRADAGEDGGERVAAGLSQSRTRSC